MNFITTQYTHRGPVCAYITIICQNMLESNFFPLGQFCLAYSIFGVLLVSVIKMPCRMAWPVHCAMGTEKSNVKERVLTNMSVVGLGCAQHVLPARVGERTGYNFNFKLNSNGWRQLRWKIKTFIGESTKGNLVSHDRFFFLSIPARQNRNKWIRLSGCTLED